MTAPQSTPLPPAPQRGESEDVFVNKSNTWVAAQEVFRQELQEQADFVNDEVVDLDDAVAVAAAAASAALTSENNASTSESNANDSKINAASSELSSSNSASAASVSESNAASSESAASSSATTASNAAAAAAASETIATTKASEASVSAASSADSAALSEDARILAQATGNYVGAWSSLTGSVAAGVSVAHNSEYWGSLVSIVDITLSEPGVSSDWQSITELSGTAAQRDTGTDFDQIPLNTNIVYPVANVAALRALTGISVGQKFQLDGHTNQGIGGGILTATKLHTTEIDDNGTLFVVGGVVIKRAGVDYVTPEMYGYTSPVGNHDVIFKSFIDSEHDSICTSSLTLNLTKVFSTSRNNKTIDLGGSVVNWNGTDDIQNDDRSRGFIYIRPELAPVFIETISSALVAGQSSFTSTSASSYEVGGYVTLSGREPGDNQTSINPSILRLCKVVSIESNLIYLDTIFGWNIDANVVSVSSVTPVINSHVSNFIFNDNQVVTPSPNTNTTAPVGERNLAVCGVSVSRGVGVSIKDIKGNNTKFPLVFLRNSLDIEVDLVECNNPAWFGGGEGYAVQASSCSRVQKTRISGTRCRHISDFTASAYSSVKDSFEIRPRQNGLITHGDYEHDIHYERCSVNIFSPASAGFSFGNYAHTITAKDCKFSQLSGYAIDIVFEECKIGIMQNQKYSNVIFRGSAVTDFRVHIADVARLSQLQQKAPGIKIGLFNLDTGSSLSIENGRAEPGNAITGFDRVVINGYLSTESDSAQLLTFQNSGDITIHDASSKNLRLRVYGDFRTLTLSGNKFTDSVIGATRSYLLSRALEGGPKVVKLINNTYDMNTAGGVNARAITLQQSGEPSGAVSLDIINQGNKFINDGGSQINSNSTFIISKYRSRLNSEEINISGIADSRLYDSGDTQPDSGSAGGPAIWNGTSWVDLT